MLTSFHIHHAVNGQSVCHLYKLKSALHGQLVNPGLDHDRISVGVFLICVINGFDQLEAQPLKKP